MDDEAAKEQKLKEEYDRAKADATKIMTAVFSPSVSGKYSHAYWVSLSLEIARIALMRAMMSVVPEKLDANMDLTMEQLRKAVYSDIRDFRKWLNKNAHERN